MGRKLSIFLCLTLLLSFFAGCGNKESTQAKIEIHVDYNAVTPEQLSELATNIVYGEYIGGQESYCDDTGMIFSRGRFRVEKNLQGETTEEEITLRWMGGTVPVAEYAEKMDEASLKKSGFDSQLPAKRGVKTVELVSESFANPAVSKKYICFLCYDPDAGDYSLISNGYAMRQDMGNGEFLNIDTKQAESISLYDEAVGGKP